jgi:cyclopropane-fatty-acyl-phospholipid synthase
MLLRSRLSRASSSSCSDCLGSNTSLAGSSRNRRTLTGWLLEAAENGFLSDFVVRTGIRRLLRQRLHECQDNMDGATVEGFIKATSAQPIALSTDKANEQHYEVPAEFYQAMLGERLKYSCCYWDEATDSLEQAEKNALTLTCRNADIHDGMSILELGCGWGSLSLWMAENYPNCQITAVSNSHSQKEFIEGRIAELQLDNLRVITADMNDFYTDLTFDRVVSVEMFEHMRNHRRLMNRIHDWLEADGKLFVHIFCHQSVPYLFMNEGDKNWMGKYFFSGGMMPSLDLLPKVGSKLVLQDQRVWNGQHYAKTAEAWLQRLDGRRAELKTLLNEIYGPGQGTRWLNRWRMFVMACQELFAYDQGKQWFVAHYLFEKSAEGK